MVSRIGTGLLIICLAVASTGIAGDWLATMVIFFRTIREAEMPKPRRRYGLICCAVALGIILVAGVILEAERLGEWYYSVVRR